MDAIETLMTEHRVIENVLDALEGCAERIDAGELVEPGDLARFASFLREFADRCHHGKEEDILFAEMVEAGFPEHAGPLAVMRAEHERGRGLVRHLRAAAEPAGPWTGEDRRRIAEWSRAFVALLRSHIQKEDTILYPMARAHMTPEALRAVGERCEAFERETTGDGEHERLHALAEELAARYAGSLPASDAACPPAEGG